MWSSRLLANADRPGIFVFTKRAKQASQQLPDDVYLETKAMICGCGGEKKRCANGNFLDCQMTFAEMQPQVPYPGTSAKDRF